MWPEVPITLQAGLLLGCLRYTDQMHGVTSVKCVCFHPGVPKKKSGAGAVNAVSGRQMLKHAQSCHLADHTLHVVMKAYKAFRATAAEAVSKSSKGGRRSSTFRSLTVKMSDPEAPVTALASKDASPPALFITMADNASAALPFPLKTPPAEDSDDVEGDLPRMRICTRFGFELLAVAAVFDHTPECD